MPATKPQPRIPAQAEPVGEWETPEQQPKPQAISSQPAGPGDWSLGEIIKALSRTLPDNMLETRKQGGQTIKYIPWHTASKILDKYAPAWRWEMTLTATATRLIVVGRLTIPTSDGEVYREATGSEVLFEERPVMIVEGDRKVPLKDNLGRVMMEQREIAFGDVSSNAESMALRRAAAKFGLGLYMYGKGGK